MTALGRQRIGPPVRRWFRPAGRTGWLVLWFLLAVAAPGAASVTERVVTDPLTGLAIGGYDPVAYFTDGKPALGRAEFEYRAEGVIWRFRNEGNRTAFAADIHVYRPRFGGYDPLAVGRGVGTAGHPDIWAIHGRRLYLFYDEKARAAFLAAPDEAVRRADETWAEVLRTLVP
jgi:hypothetical protein